MFAELPKSVQSEVLYYLKTDNFVKAKAVHDAWQKSCATQKQLNKSNGSPAKVTE